ncbi:MAG: hypothetical protein RR100_14145 [Comamonas sp.]
MLLLAGQAASGLQAKSASSAVSACMACSQKFAVPEPLVIAAGLWLC